MVELIRVVEDLLEKAAPQHFLSPGGDHSKV